MWVSLVYSIDPTISVVSTLFIAVSILILIGVTTMHAIGKPRAGQE
jgi:ABC-type spermidine/putrescine transport system permease subunit II